MPHPKKYAIVPPGKEWRDRLVAFKAAYTQRNLDHVHKDIEDKVYAMALDGAQLSTIADYFGVERTELAKVYRECWLAGRAELQAIIAADTVDYGLTSKIPVAKIWLGKSMGGLGDSGATVETEADAEDSGELKLNITVRHRKDGEAS